MDDLGLDATVVEAARKIGIEELTDPQRLAIPKILEGRNVLILAPTGIGKTEAAVLPLLHRIVVERPPPISLLYITPLRALNRDMLRRMVHFGESLGIKVAVRHGDTSQKERAALSRHPPDILITTPETFQIHFTGRRLRDHLRAVRWVVVDEVHELAADERGAQLAVVLERLVDLTGRSFQRIGLSATVGSPEEVARYLGGANRPVEVVRIRVPKDLRVFVEIPKVLAEDRKTAEALRARPIQAAAIRRCYELIRKHRSTLFFVNTRDTAEFLASRLRARYDNPPIGVHHGSLSRDVRIQMEDDFKAEKLRSLICTSSLELGIDVGSADFVLQFNSPREVTRLVQRIGRSGHGVGEVSNGTIIAANEDDFAESCTTARRALAEEFEDLPVRQNNLAVLANQIVAMTMTERFVETDRAYETICRAYPFRSLPRTLFTDVLNQLAELKTIWHREPSFGRSRGSLAYFYENISMIPDVRSYRVVDLGSRRVIGTLDEWFVSESAKLGETFVMRGTAWRFVEFKEDRIFVEPVRDIGSVPSWVGEDLPVPFEVAQEVGRLRATRDFSPYACNEEGRRRFASYLDRLRDRPVPTDRRVTIEVSREVVVVNACFGSKVNETLAQLISSLVSSRFGQSVGVQTDPYRIVIEVPRSLDPQWIVEILQPEEPDELEPLLRVVLRNSTYLRWAFVYVAKKFGAIRREVDWESVNVGRLLRTFQGTPLLEEVLNKIFWERMDLPRTVAVLRKIKSGEIEVVVTTLTNVGRAGLQGGRLLVVPQKADHATLQAVKTRLERETIHLLCLHCRSLTRSVVRDLPSKIRCPNCSGTMVAAISRHRRDRVVRLDLDRPLPADRPEVRRLFTSASLVMAHGRKAVLALVARGVGEGTAARLLRNLHETEDDFLRDVLAAEVQYARTKRFWD